MNGRTRVIFRKTIIIAMLTALCFAATYAQVRLPSGDMVHLGNFVMIMAALLLGGLEGGLVGSLGMGLYDIINYSNKPTTIIRTFLLKFLVGFIVGFLFRLVLKKKLKTNHLLIGSTVFFTLLFGGTIALFFIGDYSNMSLNNFFVSEISNFFGSGKTVKLSLFVPIFSFVFAIGMGAGLIFSRKLSNRSKAALFAITVAVAINILGEFFLRYLLEGLKETWVGGLDSDVAFAASLATATSKIPGSLLTGFISVFLAVLIYEPVYKAVKNIPEFKDNTDEFDEENIEEDEALDNTLAYASSDNKQE